jgi:hypothetical protein
MVPAAMIRIDKRSDGWSFRYGTGKAQLGRDKCCGHLPIQQLTKFELVHQLRDRQGDCAQLCMRGFVADPKTVIYDYFLRFPGLLGRGPN